MTKLYLKTAINTCHKRLRSFAKHRSALVAALLQTLLCTSLYADIQLTPYTASYESKVKGVPTELKRSLKQTEDGHWSLKNKTSLLFADFTEQASFFVQKDYLKPIKYQYKNPMSKKRDSKLRFDWEKNLVTESAKSTPPLTLKDGMLDKLTFQEQLRQDVMTLGNQFKERTYTLIDQGRTKTYNTRYEGEETITTPAGEFAAAKIKQYRSGKEKYTMIWLAKDWQYFIVRIELFEKGESRYKIALQSASIGGRKMAAVGDTR